MLRKCPGPACAVLLVLAFALPCLAQAAESSPPVCGEVVTIETHQGTTTRYALAGPLAGRAGEAPMVLVMLIGGGGYLKLDDRGCPQLLNRNVLVRMSPLLHGAGIATALVDAPSDMRSDEGLGGFRIAAEHADDLGRIVADLRARTRGQVWIVGHSRGTISAAGAAARLTGVAAPDGMVLLSAMMVGDTRARKSWVAQTVFSVDLEAIRAPVLVIGHAADNCLRSPAALMDGITAKTRGARQQTVTVTGGPVAPDRVPGLAACEVREPHDFVDQEAEVAAGIARFVRGANY